MVLELENPESEQRAKNEFKARNQDQTVEKGGELWLQERTTFGA